MQIRIQVHCIATRKNYDKSKTVSPQMRWFISSLASKIDKALKHNRPGVTLVHKDAREYTLIDVAVPADQNIIRTEEVKVERYQDLGFEIRTIHGASKVTVIPIVIGALGTISKNAKTWYGKFDLPDRIGSALLSAILGTAHVLRKVLWRKSRGELLGHNLEYAGWHQRTERIAG